MPFEDVCDLSTAWRVRVEVDDALVPGGWCEGKVVRFEVSDPSLDSFARATITVACCTGTGVAPAAGTGWVQYTGEAWDRVTWQDYSAYRPAPFPAVEVAVYVTNAPDAQLTTIQANDYRQGVAGRNDRTLNDPKNIVKQVPTTVTFALSNLAPASSLDSVIPLTLSPWAGPLQLELPA